MRCDIAPEYTYFGLRSYLPTGHDGKHAELGAEPTLAEYVANLVAVFRDVRRVLRDDGTLWLNLGDSYASNPASGGERRSRPQDKNPGVYQRTPTSTWSRPDGLKPKDLMMVPARVALALQDDGWYLRSKIVWAKPNPMPESVTDRPTNSYEEVFLLTKRARYYYDADAIAEPATEIARRPNYATQRDGPTYEAPGQSPQTFGPKAKMIQPTRNARNVWTIPTVGFPAAHFATFPPELPRRCILAGSRVGDTVLDPFSGAGTTGLVADRLGRNYIGVELNPEYVALSEARIRNDAPLFAEVAS